MVKLESKESGPKGTINFKLNSTEDDRWFVMVINVKMSIIVGILTFTSRINTSEFEGHFIILRILMTNWFLWVEREKVLK